ELEAALLDCQEVIRLGSVPPEQLDLVADLAEAFHQRARRQERAGRYERALADVHQALALAPESPQIMGLLAWILATCPKGDLRKGGKGVELARRACELSEWSDAVLLDTLAAACAEQGIFPEALAWIERAIEVEGEEEQRTDYRARRELYRAGQPYRSV